MCNTQWNRLNNGFPLWVHRCMKTIQTGHITLTKLFKLYKKDMAMDVYFVNKSSGTYHYMMQYLICLIYFTED